MGKCSALLIKHDIFLFEALQEYPKEPLQTYMSITLPSPARTSSTRFRIRQVKFSGANMDTTAMDDIKIGPMSETFESNTVS